MYLLSPTDVANVPGYPDTHQAIAVSGSEPPSGAKLAADLDRLADVVGRRVEAVNALGAEAIAAPLQTAIGQLGYVIDHAGSALRELDDTRASLQSAHQALAESRVESFTLGKDLERLSTRADLLEQRATYLAATIAYAARYQQAVEDVLRAEARAGRIARTGPKRILAAINEATAALAEEVTA